MSAVLTIEVRADAYVSPANAVGNVEQVVQKHVHRGFMPPTGQVLGYEGDHYDTIVCWHKVQDLVWHVSWTVKNSLCIAVRKHDRRFCACECLSGRIA